MTTRVPRDSPKVRMSARPGVRLRRRPSFAAVARVVELLAGSPIRGGLQAHDAVAPLAQQPPAPTHALLLLLHRRMAVAFAAIFGARVHR